MDKKKQLLPLLVALLILTNVVTVVVGNYTLLRLKGIIEGFYAQQAIEEIKEVDNILEDMTEEAKEDQILRIIDELYLRDIDLDMVEESKYKGMLEALEDPYSSYLSKEEMKELMVETEGKFGGIGIVVTPSEDGFITVVAPIEGTPGKEAGIKTGDKIVKVEGVEYFSDTMNTAVNNMRGEPDTDVTITIQRDDEDGSATFFDLTVTRDIITIQSVEYSLLDDDIGYIRVLSFDGMTMEMFEEAVTSLEADGAKGLVVDMRNNPGGLLSASIEVSDIFLNNGIIVYTINKNEKETDYFADDEWTDLPLVVLVNRGSASASEIFAGAIKDNNRGMIVGENTFGKGVVQQIYPFLDGSGLKLTTSEYFTPDGIAIHEIGIEPDIEVILDADIDGIGIDFLDQDNQLQESIKELKELMLK